MLPFDRLLAIMTKPYVIVGYISLIILSFFYFDKAIAFYVYQINLKGNFPILNWLTMLGMGILYFPTFFLLALFFRFGRVNKEWEWRAWFLLFCVSIPSLICVFLKVMLGRARPSMLFTEQMYGFYGLQSHSPFWSFPSGHTTTIMGAVLGLGIIFPRYFYALVATGLAVSLSRVLLMNHYLSDVMSAIYLTIIEVGLLLYYARHKTYLPPAQQHTV